MNSAKVPVSLLVFVVIGGLVAIAGGPLVLAFLVMGVPFVVFFLTVETIAHGHVDNGHFRSPAKPR